VLFAAALPLALGLPLSNALIARHVSVAAPAGHRTQAPGRGLSSLPLPAQAPIAGALGADQPAYHVQTSPGGFEAKNPVQRLTARFSDAGVQIASGETRVGLSLRALGYGRSLRTLGAASPRASANRVTYAHAGLGLWYVNGPLGLEQGFSIARAPSGPAGEPLTLVLALSGEVHASLARGGAGVTFSHAGGPSLLYRGLRISDARGRALSGRLELRDKSLVVRVDTQGARYPLRIDPFIQQAEKLVGSGQAGAITSRVGLSVALSADGNTALVGGPGDYGNTGAAWVFTRSGSTWTQQGSKLTGGGEQGEGQFGSSVALSAAGNTAVVGAAGDNTGLGAAWVFTRAGSTWTQQGSKLTGTGEVSSGASPGQFGASVALAGSETNTTALIGGPGDNKGLGAAWAFTRAGSAWTQQGSKLTGGEELSSTEAPGKFAAAVALFATETSTTAMIGGPGDNKGLGAAWAFTRAGSAWTQQGPKLTGGSEEVSGAGAPGEFGASVALGAAEGNTALVGGPGDNIGLGAAWAFTRASEKWTQQGSKLTGSGEVSGTAFPGEFGASVALALAEGNTALIGGPGDNSGVGAAWAFTRASEKWTQQGSKLTGGEEVSSTEAPGELGAGVVLSSDGNTGLTGGPGDNKGLGAAWAFTRSGSTWTQQGSKLTGSGASARSRGGQGESVALSSDGATALVGGPGDGLGAAWVFTRSGSTWTQQGPKLTSTEEGSEARFGARVALSANGNTALVGGPGDNKGAGAVWVFTRSGSTWTQQGSKLTGGSEESGAARFGSGVALSSDGNTAVIGGPLDTAGAGAVWAFTRASEKWSQQGAKLAGSGASGAAHLGFSVALSSDGNTALAGGPGDSGEVGAAWVFTRASEKWSQQGAKLTPSGVGGALPPLFGESAALSSDGNTALIGGPFDEAGTGAAWVFVRSGSTWSQQGAKLTGSGMTGIAAGFGLSVALSSDGNTALIGGPLDNGEAGAVWVFRHSGSTWTQEGSKLTAGGASGSAQFGVAVALSSLGNIGLIGGPKDFGGTGAAWAFVDNAPQTETKPASSITLTSATLNASVNPIGQGEVSECKFEYGTTTSYGSSAPCVPSPGSGESPVAVSASVSGLPASTTYHFRVSATNASGTSTGFDETLRTLCAAESFCTSFAAPTNLEGSFREPTAVAVDPSGNIWVADSGHNRVLEFTSKREYLRQFGSEGTGQGQFSGIQGIAANSAGDIYVTDAKNDRVQEFSPTGEFLRQFGSPGSGNGQFLGPNGIAVDSSGNVWVLDTFNYRVEEFSATGTFLSQFGSQGTGNGQFGWASGLAFSGGNLYVADNGRVEEFSTAGAFIAQFGSSGTGNGQFHGLGGIASDPTTGDLYVSDTYNNRVQKFTAAGVFLSAVGTGGSGNGQFSFPRGVAVNSSGTVYVADTGNNRLQDWLAGEPPTFATSFTPEKIEGSLSEPDAVALDPSGDIWVADSGHNRVLEFNKERSYLRRFGTEGTGQGQFRGIQGIAANSAGDVYVTDSNNDRVQEFSPTGEFLRQFGGPGSGNGQFLFPVGIAVDASGNVWVVDRYNYRVEEFSATGGFLSQFGSQGTGNGQFGWASGLAFSGGNLYVADSSRVEEFSTAGAFIAQFGSPGTGNGQFHGPGGIATDPTTGNLYVSDIFNNRVQEFSAAGAFIAAFGTGGSGNGQFSRPRGVAVNSSATLYVADTGNNRVQEWVGTP
jgi:sugar lactone lactonase YvrE